MIGLITFWAFRIVMFLWGVVMVGLLVYRCIVETSSDTRWWEIAILIPPSLSVLTIILGFWFYVWILSRPSGRSSMGDY